MFVYAHYTQTIFQKHSTFLSWDININLVDQIPVTFNVTESGNKTK